MPLKNRLKEYRAALNVNQQELGHLAGVSRQTISLIERGGLLPLGDPGPEVGQNLPRKVEDIFILEEDEPS